jgi:hypothetical protein
MTIGSQLREPGPVSAADTVDDWIEALYGRLDAVAGFRMLPSSMASPRTPDLTRTILTRKVVLPRQSAAVHHLRCSARRSVVINAYPLSWPAGRPRSAIRQRARFHRRIKTATRESGWQCKVGITVRDGVSFVFQELERLGASEIVISSDLETRRDGLPHGNAREPKDPGVAVYFQLESGLHCLACDRWDRVADNLAAIGHHIEAIRGIGRWGVGDTLQAFAGYKTLPAVDTERNWWTVLGFDQPPGTLETVRIRWRQRIAEAHPDRGGSTDQAAEINAAMADAEKFYSSK